MDLDLKFNNSIPNEIRFREYYDGKTFDIVIMCDKVDVLDNGRKYSVKICSDEKEYSFFGFMAEYRDNEELYKFIKNKINSYMCYGKNIIQDNYNIPTDLTIETPSLNYILDKQQSSIIYVSRLIEEELYNIKEEIQFESYTKSKAISSKNIMNEIYKHTVIGDNLDANIMIATLGILDNKIIKNNDEPTLKTSVLVINYYEYPKWCDLVQQFYKGKTKFIMTENQLKKLIIGNQKKTINKDLKKLKRSLSSIGHLNIDEINSHNLIVISYEFYDRFWFYCNQNQLMFQRVIYSNVKNSQPLNGDYIPSHKYYYLTSSTSSFNKYKTPHNIHFINNLYLSQYKDFFQHVPFISKEFNYLYNMRYLLFTHKIDHTFLTRAFDVLFIRNDKKFIHTRISTIINEIYYNIKSNSIFINNSIIENINMDNLIDAIQEMGINIKSHTNTLAILTKFYNDKLKMYDLENIKPENKIQIDKLKQNIKDIQNRINLADNDCPICMDKIEKPTVVHCCVNLFCFKCIALTLNTSKSCPMCRAELTTTDQITLIDNNVNDTTTAPIDTFNVSDIQYVTKQSKSRNCYQNLGLLLEHIKSRDDDHRIIVAVNKDLSDYEKIIKTFASQKMRLDNSIEECIYKPEKLKKFVNSYKKGDLFKCISIQHMYYMYRIGILEQLNLECTTDVIYIDDDDEIYDKSIMMSLDGYQNKNINIWKLLTS